MMRDIKTREGFEFWDKLNALPRYAFLLSPSGNSVQKFEDQAMGNWIDVHEAQKIVDQAQDRISELRDELGAVKGEYDRAVNKVDALQQRLNAVDQRVDELEALLVRSNELFYAIQGDPGAVPSSSIDAMRGDVFTALKPAARSTYKPGLYAVRHIDNWDGERDVVLTFAMLDADGKWTDKETGESLLTYTGDKVLRAWPLDCSDAPDTQIIGVPRNWLEDWALELVEAAQDGGQMSNQVEHLLEIHAKP
ncbi:MULTISPECIES: coiled-coil domain-containing protein [unclassified Pseudomonas]|uniref:coiled-coil domain-containing protein n=1 Tax=unclassified Pseudomonas TaxID=196821 RepID=UPI00215B9FD7|nr:MULTISPECIES: hypothetical protein [unclassified Pseudomonas]MCR8931972.1 hypothetical protein [Pseudomonas sp. S11A4]MCR8975581.1 hypothetical protein [Pseudomonas sp. S11P7]